MSKTYNQAYREIVERHYTEGGAGTALISFLINNNNFKYEAISAVTDTVENKVKYNISRRNRLKGSVVENPQDRTFDAQKILLDQHSEAEWDTQAVTINKLRLVGVKKYRLDGRDAYDIDWSGELYNNLLADSHANLIETRVEDTLEEIVTNTPASAISKLDTNIWAQINAKATAIRLYRDNFKSIGSRKDTAALLHPEIIDRLSETKGKEFRNETPVFSTGLSTAFNINNIAALEIDALNAVDVTVGTEQKRVAAIILDRDAFAYGVDKQSDKVIVSEIGLNQYIGRYFSDIYKLIDTKRVQILYFDSTTDKTEKVNKK